MSEAVEWTDLPRDSQAVLYCLSVLHDLVDKGLVKPGSIQVSENCHGIHEEMKKAGFAPTQAEMTEAMSCIQQMCFKN